MGGLIGSGAGCREAGVRPPRCGNGVVEGREQCDDGNLDPGDGCSPQCIVEGGEICGNYEDDDGDDRADCADVDCLGHPSCEQDPPLENCHNSFDDDGDGKADCEDEDCQDTSFCVPDEDCENGIDDDRDGLTDCEDPSCSTLPLCGACDPEQDIDTLAAGDEIIRILDEVPFGESSLLTCPPGSAPDHEIRFASSAPLHVQAGVEVLGATGAGVVGLGLIREEAPDESCDRDEVVCETNDASGMASWGFYALPPGTYRLAVKAPAGFGDPGTATITLTAIDGTVESDCANGIDEDGDGRTDCEDADCAEFPACVPEDCENAIDDNENGLTDCQDPACFTAPACLPPETCTNGLDDDGDGRTDCADLDCAGSAPCAGSECVVNHQLGTLSRGDTVEWSFSTDLAVDNVAVSCAAGAGPDLVGGFRLTHDSNVAFSFTQQGYHVVALATESGATSWCDDAEIACLDPGGVDLGLERHFMLPAARYFLLVEAVSEAATGLGTMELQIYDPSVELCDDSLDNDGDGQTDCADDDCTADPACVPETRCHDGLDDDGDGWTDCADLDCMGTNACFPAACVPDRDMGPVGPLNPGFITSSTSGQSDRHTTPCALGGGGPDRVIAFSLQSESAVTLRLNQDSGADHVMTLALPAGPAGDCDTAIYLCEEAGSAGLPVVVQLETLPAGVYYVIVDTYGPWGEGGFTLQVSLP